MREITMLTCEENSELDSDKSIRNRFKGLSRELEVILFNYNRVSRLLIEEDSLNNDLNALIKVLREC